MKKALIVALFCMVGGMSGYSQDGPGTSPKILIAYFSLTNRTHTMAQQIHSRIGGDMVRVEPKIPYSQVYDEVAPFARREFGKRPANLSITHISFGHFHSPASPSGI